MPHELDDDVIQRLENTATREMKMKASTRHDRHCTNPLSSISARLIRDMTGFCVYVPVIISF